MRSELGIIPNKELLNVQDYYKYLEPGERHGKYIKYFSDKYNLGITPESLGLSEGEYCGYRYQIAMASLGHMVLCYDEEIWIFLPEFLSQNQKDYFKEKEKFFKKYHKCLYYAIVDTEKNIIDSREYGAQGNILKSLYYYVKNSVDFSLESRGR